MTYRVFGDSCTDVPEELASDPHFVKVALTIHVGPDTIVDDESFDQQNLLKKMRAWPDAPKTACPSPSIYLEQFLLPGPRGHLYPYPLRGSLRLLQRRHAGPGHLPGGGRHRERPCL